MRCLSAAALLLCAAAASAQSAGELHIYRCTAADGSLSLRDSPCPSGQQQQIRTMLRPQDAPAPTLPSTPAPAPVAAAATAAPIPIYLAPPRPMYECSTADGQHYNSDDGRGNPRWVPYWTLGYPAMRSSGSLGRNIGNPETRLHPPMRDIVRPVAGDGGTWIRDTCVMLPPIETCARLRDRRSAIGTRFFNAQPSERDRLRLAERSLNARLDNDCGGH